MMLDRRSRSGTNRLSPVARGLFGLGLFAAGARLAPAGGDIWTTSGPTGGVVTVLAISPSSPATIYAGTPRGGVFRTTNAGWGWQCSGRGLSDRSVWGLAIDPSNAATVYAAADGGVFKSTNGGGSWMATSTGMGPYVAHVLALVVDPSNPSTLYAGTDWAGGTRVFKTMDGAKTWQKASKGIPDWEDAETFAIDPSNPLTIYAGTNGPEVYKTSNGGATWTSVYWGGTNTEITSVVIDPVDTRTVYAGARGQVGEVLKSTDGGGTWRDIYITNWEDNIGIYALALNPLMHRTVYASTDRGLFKSTSGGASWAAIDRGRGLTNRTVLTLATDSSGAVYAGTDGGGVFRSTDGGGSWSALPNGFNNSYAEALLISQSNPLTLYAGTGGEPGFEGGDVKSKYGAGAFKSTDAGQTWSGASAGLGCSSVSRFAEDPFNPAVLYAATYGGGVFKSTDGAGTWTAVNTGLTRKYDRYLRALVLDPLHPGTLYAGSDRGVFKTTNGGRRWTLASTGMPIPLIVQDLAISPYDTSTLYASTIEGVFKSTDAAASWRKIVGQGFVFCLAIDPSNPRTVYAGTWQSGGHIYKSTDAGATWRSYSGGLPTIDFSVWAIAIDPTDPMTLYAGTESYMKPSEGGVYRSTDGGATWKPFNAGLTNTHLRALAIDPSNPNRVYAGTDGGGVFSIDITGPRETLKPRGVL